jgi:hypothetical protein
MAEELRGNRWYDKHEKLAVGLEALKNAEAPKRHSVVGKILELLNRYAPYAVASAQEQAQPSVQRRWYDSSPQLWTAVNALKFSDMETIAKTTSLLGDELAQNKKPQPKK